MEFISLVGSRRKGHWVGLFSTGFFFLGCLSPLNAIPGGSTYIFTAMNPWKYFYILL